MRKICPLAAVDRRLADALRLWNAARLAYFDPDLFRTNVQSAIQALRSVTWILQKEKNLIPNFDAWYKLKQNQMRADPVLSWLVDARNRIEKQGDLITRSTVRTTTFVGWLDSAEHEMALPPNFTAEMLAGALAASLGKQTIEDGTVIRVERRWVDSELPQFEILEALSHAYEQLQLLVFEAHGLFPEPLVGICEFQARLRLSNFVLPEEMLHPFARYQWIDARSGKPIHVDYKTEEVEAAEATQQARKHYGSKFAAGSRATEPPATFREQCEFFFSRAKVIMAKDGYHYSTALLEKGPQTQIVQFFPDTRAAKHAYMRDIADLAKRIAANSVMIIGEAWTASIPIEKIKDLVHAADMPDRGEALNLIGINKSGECFEITVHFSRKDGQIIYGPEERREGLWPNIVAPFRQALGLDDQLSPQSNTENPAADGSKGDKSSAT